MQGLWNANAIPGRLLQFKCEAVAAAIALLGIAVKNLEASGKAAVSYIHQLAINVPEPRLEEVSQTLDRLVPAFFDNPSAPSNAAVAAQFSRVGGQLYFFALRHPKIGGDIRDNLEPASVKRFIVGLLQNGIDNCPIIDPSLQDQYHQLLDRITRYDNTLGSFIGAALPHI